MRPGPSVKARRHPAHPAHRWRDTLQVLPAGPAERVAAAGVEPDPAHGAEWGEEQVDGGDDPAAPARARAGGSR